MLWLVCLPACFPCGFCAFNQLFMTDTPTHWCKVPELQNLTTELRKNLSIPQHNNTFSSCLRYSVNWTEVLQTDFIDLKPNKTWPVEKCLQGYEYDTTDSASSIVINVRITDSEN